MRRHGIPQQATPACELLNVSPSECYAVEDSPNGIRSASQAGMKPLMVPDLVAPAADLLPMIYKKFDDLLKVRDFLKN